MGVLNRGSAPRTPGPARRFGLLGSGEPSRSTRTHTYAHIYILLILSRTDKERKMRLGS